MNEEKLVATAASEVSNKKTWVEPEFKEVEVNGGPFTGIPVENGTYHS